MQSDRMTTPTSIDAPAAAFSGTAPRDRGAAVACPGPADRGADGAVPGRLAAAAAGFPQARRHRLPGVDAHRGRAGRGGGGADGVCRVLAHRCGGAIGQRDADRLRLPGRGADRSGAPAVVQGHAGLRDAGPHGEGDQLLAAGALPRRGHLAGGGMARLAADAGPVPALRDARRCRCPAAAGGLAAALPPRAVAAHLRRGAGLTVYKIAAEYLLIALMGRAALGFHRRAGRSRRYDAPDLRTAALITILGELCFTLYSNVNDVFQLLGHAYKIVAYLFIYRAVFVVGVREPYERLSVEMAERRRTEQRIEFLAFHDPLTELPNRVLARDRVERCIAAANREGRTVALVYLDLDHFKNVNDSLGHGAGDRLLQSVARRLRACLRETDTISRQGATSFSW
ncbi:diguanylate cyclase [Piscinibacter aquaticus]|uniref:Diguanylate cyclase n=1 Tax=Piscinibacter aquaticus TaxID=392597 RepID=A0A5C6U1Z6_9BURK|nr:diguanylate cyclase [Piscinibacter aquaticus]